MEEKDTVRATVETVAENTVDAFVSPLLFALLGGAPLAMLYRAANTLDSMVGYRNDRYLYFGWASARLDDLLNYIPARIAGILDHSSDAFPWIHRMRQIDEGYLSVCQPPSKSEQRHSGVGSSRSAGHRAGWTECLFWRCK